MSLAIILLIVPYDDGGCLLDVFDLDRLGGQRVVWDLAHRCAASVLKV